MKMLQSRGLPIALALAAPALDTGDVPSFSVGIAAHGSGGPLWSSDIGDKHELMEAIIRAAGDRSRHKGTTTQEPRRGERPRGTATAPTQPRGPTRRREGRTVRAGRP